VPDALPDAQQCQSTEGICIYKDQNCVLECVGDDAYAMSHLSAVNLATDWLGTHVNACAADV